MSKSFTLARYSLLHSNTYRYRVGIKYRLNWSRWLLPVAIFFILAGFITGIMESYELSNKQIVRQQIRLQELHGTLRQVLEQNTQNDTQLKQKAVEERQLRSKIDDLNKQLQSKRHQQRLVTDLADAIVPQVEAASLPGGSHTSWMAQAGIDSSEYDDTDYIISHESSWNVYDRGSPTNLGQACGLAQELPCGKSGCHLEDVVCELHWFKNYCQSAYGSIHKAYLFWLDHHWY